ncbi:TetR/AcrR family transcriptional regulator [Pseudomonas putida]|uniref:TetR/AcrR family transcriptional regulator n=1 Tax=Pseudomonas putida TaxID=303 RepID=UPI001F51D4DE|nr:TetR/AcrR family transcriptional regulator [Pseudomonas putida]MCI1025389.1 TetR/AcrR family transcriptional regulator [Pseudomonas putida]
MGRRKTIDRDEVLRVAEGIVARDGASALTIDAVAKAAGITKGGVQSCFKNKESLIDAMLKRWQKSYEESIEGIAGKNPDPLDRVRAHVESTHGADTASQGKAAGLLASLIDSPDHLRSVQEWYQQRLNGIDVTTEEGRRARLAFLATEGAFFLRYFGFMQIDQEQWQELFADIKAL